MDALETLCFAMEDELVHFTLLKTVYSEGVRNEIRGESRGLCLFSQRPQRLLEKHWDGALRKFAFERKRASASLSRPDLLLSLRTANRFRYSIGSRAGILNNWPGVIGLWRLLLLIPPHCLPCTT